MRAAKERGGEARGGGEVDLKRPVVEFTRPRAAGGRRAVYEDLVSGVERRSALEGRARRGALEGGSMFLGDTDMGSTYVLELGEPISVSR